MTDAKIKKPLGVYPILVWMAINAFFMILELTVLSDYTDLNNSIELILWISSIIGLALFKKWGAALSTFTLSYTMSTSMANIIYYNLWTINGPRVIINAIAVIYMFKLIFENKFR